MIQFSFSRLVIFSILFTTLLSNPLLGQVRYKLKVTNRETGRDKVYRKKSKIYLKVNRTVYADYINDYNTADVMPVKIVQFVSGAEPGLLVKMQNKEKKLILLDDIAMISGGTKKEYRYLKAASGLYLGFGVFLASLEIPAGWAFIGLSTPLLLVKRKVFDLNSDSFAEIIRK